MTKTMVSNFKDAHENLSFLLIEMNGANQHEGYQQVFALRAQLSTLFHLLDAASKAAKVKSEGVR